MNDSIAITIDATEDHLSIPARAAISLALSHDDLRQPIAHALSSYDIGDRVTHTDSIRDMHGLALRVHRDLVMTVEGIDVTCDGVRLQLSSDVEEEVFEAYDNDDIRSIDDVRVYGTRFGSYRGE